MYIRIEGSRKTGMTMELIDAAWIVGSQSGIYISYMNS